MLTSERVCKKTQFKKQNMEHNVVQMPLMFSFSAMQTSNVYKPNINGSKKSELK